MEDAAAAALSHRAIQDPAAMETVANAHFVPEHLLEGQWLGTQAGKDFFLSSKIANTKEHKP